MYLPAAALLAIFLPALTLADNKVNVTVYYESLCPDSQKFINNQLYPAYKTPLASYINLQLVPYGNANTSADGEITCQHGPVECYGNKVQACAIAKLSTVDKQLDFINCLMKKAYDNKPANETLYKAFIKSCINHSSDQLMAIEQCANSSEATQLMYMYGNMTKKASPPIKGVPTTFFNEKSSKEINDGASKNFTSELCTFIDGTKPHECGSGKGSASDVVGSLALIASALLLARFH